jgi:hypothetical protein
LQSAPPSRERRSEEAGTRFRRRVRRRIFAVSSISAQSECATLRRKKVPRQCRSGRRLLPAPHLWLPRRHASACWRCGSTSSCKRCKVSRWSGMRSRSNTEPKGSFQASQRQISRFHPSKSINSRQCMGPPVARLAHSARPRGGRDLRPTRVSAAPRVPGIHGRRTGAGSRHHAIAGRFRLNHYRRRAWATARSICLCPWNAIGCVRWSLWTPGWDIRGKK